MFVGSADTYIRNDIKYIEKMKMSVDLHIHTVLSGCCFDDNTVNNVVNMCQLLEKDFIAFADHNSMANCAVGAKLAEQAGILFVPAMEVTSAEDIHCLCLFRELKNGLILAEEIEQNLPKFPLDTRFYSPQKVLNENDETVCEIKHFLNLACHLDIYSLKERVEQLGGIMLPAHIDRPANSMLATLGEMPVDLPFTAVELSSKASDEMVEEYSAKYKILRSSDAHTLESLCTFNFQLDLKEKSIDALFAYLQNE